MDYLNAKGKPSFYRYKQWTFLPRMGRGKKELW